MAIKTIHHLDKFDNGTDNGVNIIGGNLRMFSNNITDNDKNSNGPGDFGHTSFSIKDSLNQNSLTYNQALFEVSRPVDQGEAGVNSSNFDSFKITYKDLAKNIILDTKAYLNRRNNLGEFNLCALAYANYDFKGHKRFLSGRDSQNTDGNYSGCGVDIEGVLSVTNNCIINDSLSVKKDISCLNLYTGTLTSNSDGTKIDIGNGYFIVMHILSADANALTIEKFTHIKNNLSVFGHISAHDAYFDGSLTARSNISVGNNLSVRRNLDVDGKLSAKDACFEGDVVITSKLKVDGIADLTAEHAKWSDLAEYYLADKKYEPGTLVQFGGDNEVTIATNEVNAVVTTNPAFLMNCSLRDNENRCAIALAGRVPVKVIGKVKKFDKLVLSNVSGVARAKKKFEFWKKPIGIALENNITSQSKLIECIIKYIF